MRNVSGGFRDISLSNVAQTLCSIVTITRQDGYVYRFTDLDGDFRYAGNVYSSQFGFNGSAIQLALGVSGQTQTLTLLLDLDRTGVGIDIQSLLTSKLDYAKVVFSWVDYESPERGQLDLYAGLVTQADFGDFSTVSLQIQSRLNQQQAICSDKFSATCRYDFGDTGCGYDISTTHDQPRLYQVIDQQTLKFELSETSPAGYYRNGSAYFSTGVLAGLSFEIADNQYDTDGRCIFYLKVPMPDTPMDDVTWLVTHPSDPHGGVLVDLYGGCDKAIDSGCTYWGNTPRFGGEPFVPQTSVTAGAPPAPPSAAPAPAVPPAATTASPPAPVAPDSPWGHIGNSEA